MVLKERVREDVQRKFVLPGAAAFQVRLSLIQSQPSEIVAQVMHDLSTGTSNK